MKLPTGKTKCRIIDARRTFRLFKRKVFRTDLKKGDTGYIDGYVRGVSSCPHAVFVRDSDGVVDLLPLDRIQALD